jgi:hypothetical protein
VYGSLQGPVNARYGVELAKGDSEQAGAQQHKAGRGQGEEAVGHEVMIAHVAPFSMDAGPKMLGLNLLKISESASCTRQTVPRLRSGPRTKAFQCMGKEDAGANQAQKR